MYTAILCILFYTLLFIQCFYLLKKELCSENVLELSYKIVTGFKQHLNDIRKFVFVTRKLRFDYVARGQRFVYVAI